jgi:hypothetical protein
MTGYPGQNGVMEEWATIRPSGAVIGKRCGVTRGLVAGDRFLDCDRVRHEALQRAGQLTNFRVARHSFAISAECQCCLKPANHPASRATLLGWLPFDPSWPGSEAAAPLEHYP